MRLALLILWIQISNGIVSYAGLTSIFSIVCAVIAVGANERPTTTSLNHWDEALAYLFIHSGAHLLGR